MFAIRGPIAQSDLPGLYARVCRLLDRSDPIVAFCDVHGVPADGVSIEALARLQLVAGRHGCQIRLRNASPELLDLIAFTGLGSVLPE